jgi:hypothetical protein
MFQPASSATAAVEPAQPSKPERVQQIAQVLVAETVQQPSVAIRAEEITDADR